MTDPRVTPFRIPPAAISDETATAVLGGAVSGVATEHVIEITGPGTIACLQGLLTSDIENAGTDGFLYGAVLTAKGMIVCDMWATRAAGRVWLTVPAQGVDALKALFRRTLPPRLAKPIDHVEQLAVLRVAGPDAVEAAARAGIPVPEPGGSTDALVKETACLVSRPAQRAPFGLQIQLDRTRAAAVMDALRDAGVTDDDGTGLELARILAGWPRLGAEIDEKTLPQEVRYDDIDGVSYTKGCYTGQETVARLHFRGHTNKSLTGLIWDDVPHDGDDSLTQGDRSAGRVTSVSWLPPFEQFIGLAIVRRQIDRSQTLTAAGAPAGAVALPFEMEV